MEAHEIVAERVKSALKKKGWTQSDLAKELGITREAVNQALGRNIEIATLFKWASKLGVDPSELVGGPQERKPEAMAYAVLSSFGLSQEKLSGIQAVLACDDPDAIEVAVKTLGVRIGDTARKRVKPGAGSVG